MGCCSGAFLGKNIWGGGPGPQARIQKCGLGSRVPKHSNGGAEGVDGGGGLSPSPVGMGSGEGAGLCPLPRKILTFSPSKWCILMHSGARFRPIRPITAIMMFMTSIEFYDKIDNNRMSHVREVRTQKGRPRNVCVDFSGGVQPP